MKTIASIILTIAFALMLNIFFAPIIGSLISPLVIGVACYWFWRFVLGQRLVFAFVLGSLLDMMGFLPMGTYTLIFVCMAYVCESMKSFFSNTGSRMVMALNIIILIIIFRVLITPASLLISL